LRQETYRACLIGCGRMGATIDDEVRDRPDSFRWLPYSHAAACGAVERLSLAAVSDVVPAKVEAARERYRVARGYTDYREMIEQERPELLCIATRPATHAETVVFAAEHGVRALYCEKPLCCSMEEADTMVAACEQHGVHFNYGTQRRYIPLYRTLRELIDTGGVGHPQALIAHCGIGAALWSHTHTADMLMYLAGDSEIDYVQGTVHAGDEDWDGERLTTDPGIPMGYARCRNGIHAYMVAGFGFDFEVSGSEGTLRTLNDGMSVQWRRAQEPWRLLEEAAFLDVPRESGTVNGLRELVSALDGQGETTGGIQRARASLEMVFGIVESHRRGGARVRLPLANRQLAIRPEGW
jgi:scyllo-inositol 2-dehydrogenase (NAD+)